MLGTLDSAQIEDVLGKAVIGRIGCVSDGRPYVVPIAYVYEKSCIYGHSIAGKKLAAMRENPRVCFEVECVDDLQNWQSVIASGTFEELDEAGQRAGMQLLIDRLMPLLTHTAGPKGYEHGGAHPPHHGAVVFRIRLDEKSGRFESS